jgi:hypothetical protein
MYFHHHKKIIYTTIVVLVFLVLVRLFWGNDLKVFVLFLSIFLAAIAYQLGYYWILEGDTLYKYVFFREVCKIEIKQIQSIEAIKIKEFGKAYIEIGKGPFEDRYTYIMKDGSTFTTMSTCCNKQGITIGRYLHKQFKIKFIEKDKIKFFNT